MKKHYYLYLFLGLYLFIASLSGFKEAWELILLGDGGQSWAEGLLDRALAHPISGLFAGVVITSLFQSSSATIALMVATVSSGAISIEQSVFVLLGANIGTTVTSAIVALGHAVKKDEFKRAVPAAILDDMFKLLNVTLFFVLELMFGILHKSSVAIVNSLESFDMVGGFLEHFPDLLDSFVGPFIDLLVFLLKFFPLTNGGLGIALGIVSLLVLFGALRLMAFGVQKMMKSEAKRSVEQNAKTHGKSFLVGFVVCWILQSSSVSISIMLPFVALEMLSMNKAYFYVLGAALATTCDPGQLISYVRFGPIGLKTGLVHILLNVFGVIIFGLIPGLNRLPVIMARSLGQFITKTKLGPAYMVAYVLLVFYGFPALVIYLVS